jgi:1-acyl-sn-glycerol-3-phosphate acyltransferase
MPPPPSPPALDPAALLEVIRALVAELHPQRAQRITVALDSTLEGELGLDSLSRMELVARVEQQLGVTLSEQAVAQAETPADLLRAAHGGGSGSPPALRTAPLRESAPLGGRIRDAAGVPQRASTLLEVLEWYGEADPSRTHVLLYEDDTPTPLTYGELLLAGREVASGLLRGGVAGGDRVAIMLPTGIDYLASFFGALLAGAVPVPIYPPARPSQIEDHLRRHAGILSNAGVAVLIAPSDAQPVARLLRMHVESLRAIPTVAELRAAATPPGRPPVRSDDIAYLQYTSGSTGQPKGVVLSHANVLANIRAMGTALRVTPEDVFVSWLPLYHDMGLIGAWLGSLYYGTPLVLMSPLRFLARPERWLKAIHQHRATLSGGPNFAYELLLRMVRDKALEGLDLSSWRVAFNGAEPVQPETLERFVERFAPHGFRRTALMPVYGLAENGVGLAFPPLERGPWIDRVQRAALTEHARAVEASESDPNALRIPACGLALPGHELRIANDAGVELGEREEGRIQFRGPSSTRGYYRNPEATRGLLLGAGRETWLDSGDIGYLARGEVFITGRHKDIIIRAGRNIYPHELEEAIGAIDGIRKGSVAVFGTRDAATGTEKLVAIAETRFRDPGQLEGLRQAVGTAAVDLLGMPLDDVVLAKPHTVPKTSSGKIRRAASRALYEQGLGTVKRRAVWLQVLRLRIAGVLPLIRRSRRRAGDLLFGMWGAVLLAAIAPPAWLLIALSPRPAMAWAVLRVAARAILRLTGTPVAVRGLEHLPAGRPCILVVNHGSYLDGLLIAAALPGSWSFVAKRELAASGPIRIFLDRLGSLYVERFDAQRGAEDAKAVAEAALLGRALVYFPEGTFSRMPGLLPFYLGGFTAAVEAGVPLVPVAMRGTRSMLRDGHWLLRRTLLSVTVCPPILPGGKPREGQLRKGRAFAAAVALRDRARAVLLPLVGEPDLAVETGMVAKLAPAAKVKPPEA